MRYQQPTQAHRPKCRPSAVYHAEASRWNLGHHKRSWRHHTTAWTNVSDLVGNLERWGRKWGWWRRSSYKPQPGWRPLPAAAAAGSDCTPGEGCGRSALWEPKDKTQKVKKKTKKHGRGASGLELVSRSSTITRVCQLNRIQRLQNSELKLHRQLFFFFAYSYSIFNKDTSFLPSCQCCVDTNSELIMTIYIPK